MFWSDSGSFLSSSSMRVLMMSRAVRAETSSPSSVSSPLEKKNFSSNTPRGVCTYFAAAHAAHGGLVHVDLARDLLQRERPQERDALVEELALLADDAVHHLDHRAAALLDGLDQPARRVQLALDVLARLDLARGALGLLLVAHHALVGGRDAQARQVPVVQHDHVLVVHPLDHQVGHDVLGVLARDLQPGLGVERAMASAAACTSSAVTLSWRAISGKRRFTRLSNWSWIELPRQRVALGRAPRAG